uniref:Helicase ATP-binding domain-containing protein n=1 Tax=Pithovirus LCPAC001 TaxID=2506585 RepID=A0A481Z4I7_9VIRU|nr:MAG: uncharacterized protein LCPAC001_00700 [Pithovirus LCPAC001]
MERKFIPELDDFFYSYPKKNLQSRLSTLKEYNELQSKRKDVIDPLTGNFTHQNFAHRFMLNYNRLLLLWEAGSGKTWGGIGAADQFRKLKQEQELDIKTRTYPQIYFNRVHTYIKRTYIVVKNRSLISTFINTIYQRTDIKTKKELKQYYTLVTYTGFYNIINDLNPKQRLEKFKNTFVIIDEAHNVKPSSTKKKRGSKSSDGTDFKKIYNSYMNLFQMVDNMKIILMTATPMIDNVSEAGYLFNLILPRDIKMPLRPSDYYNVRDESPLTSNLKMKETKIVKWFKNIISYVNVPDLGIELVYNGEHILFNYPDQIATNDVYLDNRVSTIEVDDGDDINTTNVIKLSTIVEKCYMSGIQLEVYENEYFKVGNKIASFHGNIRKINNFVFPDGSYGDFGIINNTELVDKYFKSKKIIEGSNYDRLEFTNEFEDKYVNVDNMLLDNDLSCKFNRILEIIKSKDEEGIPGIIYIFFPELKKYGAFILDALIRIVLNYHKYFFTGNMKKKKRIAVISGETSNIQTVLDQINEEINYKGEYVRIVITTSAAGEGFSINNATTIIQAESTWNESTSYQAIRRGYRAKGFSRIIKEFKDIKVNVYKMAVIPDSEDETSGSDYEYEDEDDVLIENIDSGSFDVDRYFGAEHKDWYIRRLKRYMKKTAVDCIINRERNVLDLKLQYTADCDYDICDYTCSQQKLIRKDTLKRVGNTYGLLYYDLSQLTIEKKVKNDLKNNNIINLNVLIAELVKSGFTKRIIVNSLSDILSGIETRDRYGFLKYIYEDRGYIYLSDDRLTGVEDYNMSIYSSMFIIEYENELSTEIDRIIQFNVSKKVNDITIDNFKEQFYSLNVQTKAKMLQDYIIRKVHNRPQDIDLMIEKYMKGNYFEMNEPVGLMLSIRFAMEEKGKRGRDPKNFRKITPSKWKQIAHGKESKKYKIGELIYIHYAHMFEVPKSSRTSGLNRFDGNIRILKSPYLEWKKLNPYEQQTYSRLINETLMNTRKEIVIKNTGHFLLDKYTQKKNRYKLSPIYIVHDNFNNENIIIIPGWFLGKLEQSYPIAYGEKYIYYLKENKKVLRSDIKTQITLRNVDNLYAELYNNALPYVIFKTKLLTPKKKPYKHFEYTSASYAYTLKKDVKSEIRYRIHGNEGSPYIVIINKDLISAYTYLNDIEKYNGFYSLNVLTIDGYIGYWTNYDSSPYKIHGNNILVKISRSEYVLISDSIYSFKTKQDVIHDFAAPIGINILDQDKRKNPRGTKYEGLNVQLVIKLIEYFGYESPSGSSSSLSRFLYNIIKNNNLILYI